MIDQHGRKSRIDTRKSRVELVSEGIDSWSIEAVNIDRHGTLTLMSAKRIHQVVHMYSSATVNLRWPLSSDHSDVKR
jgi:hypothetical protein